MRVEKKSLTKLPDQPKRVDFGKEIGDIIMFLSRVFGKRDASQFKEWMFPFIQAILDGKQ